MSSPTKVRFLSGLALAGLIFLDIIYHAEAGSFLAAYPLAGIIACAVMALVLAVLVTLLVTGRLSVNAAYQKWLAEPSTSTINIIVLAGLLFVALLLRYSLVSFFNLTPTALVFVALFVCVIGLWRLKGTVVATDERKQDRLITMRFLLIGILLGLYLVIAAAGHVAKENAVTVERTAMGWGLAYFAVLFLVGFLFAIPKVLQTDSKPGDSGYDQRVNTNLEQISDWLTKIIVGLGLVELRAVPDKLQNAAKWMAQSLATPGTQPSDALISFAGAFIIFFSVLGFFAGYLATRLFLSAAFYRADLKPKVVYLDKDDYSAADPTVEEMKKALLAKPENRAKLEKWLENTGNLTAPFAALMTDPQYAALRQQALNDKTLELR